MLIIMTIGARQNAVLGAVNARGAISLTDLEKKIGASVVTLRRDLSHLESAGKLRRTHGGAMALDRTDEPFKTVLSVNSSTKRAIAKAAALQIQDHQTIILDVGTTVHYLAAELVDRPLTIITASLAIFESFEGEATATIILLGGDYMPDYHCLTGFMTEQSLKSLHADQAFLGCSGVSVSGGIRDTTASQVPVKRAILRASERTTLLVDSSKCPGTGSTTVASISDVDQIITDAPLAHHLTSMCASASTRVTLT